MKKLRVRKDGEIMKNYAQKLLLAKLSFYMDQDELEKAMLKLNMTTEELSQLSGTTEVKYLHQDREHV